MEKPTKSTKMRFLRFLPKATAITFQNLPYSPTKAHKIVLPGQLIPSEARLRPNRSLAQEPTSPKISCMGQIKLKKHVKNVAKQVDSKQVVKQDNVKKPIRTRKVAGRKSDVTNEKVPSLSQMKRFASGKETMKDFDWTAEISGADGEEKDNIIPFSGRVLVNNAVSEPRKEINLWTRRTMAKPKPLLV